MKNRTRRGIFFLFVSAFFITAPLIILHTAGYRYNFQTGRVLQTGVLSVETVPRAVMVKIDDKSYRERTPVVIDDITPGKYLIQLEKEGYLPWQKNLEIKSQETTFIIDTALFLDEETTVELENLHLINTSKNAARSTYIISQEGWAEVWMQDSNTGDVSLLARLPSSEDLTIEIDWSADASAVAIKSNSKSNPFYSLIDTRTKEGTSITDLVEDATEGFWDTKTNKYYIKTKRGISMVEIGEETIQPLPIETTAATSDGSSLITTQTINNKVVVSRETNDKAAILAYLPLGDYQFHPAPNGLNLLYNNQKNLLVLLDARGGDQPILLNKKATSWQWSKDGTNRLLYTDGFSLQIYSPANNNDETLTRLSTPIIDLAWDPKSDTVFYAHQDSITAIELDFRDTRITTNLSSQNNIKKIWTDEEGDSLHFSTSEDEKETIHKRRLRK